MSLQLAVILVPVVFGMMGFALDLGRLYLVRGELSQAAAAAAIAAATQLNGTAASLDRAGTVATQTLALNRYNFGSLTLGQDTGNLTSTISEPAYFATVAGALGTDPNGVVSRWNHRPPRANQRHGRCPAPVLEPALGGRIAQNSHRRAGARRRERALVHGLRHRALRHRGQGRE